MADVVAPPVQVYVHGPGPLALAVSVLELPGQILTGFPVMVTVGKGFTFTVADLTPVQPAVVPVAVYTVVIVGDTGSVEPVGPVFHVNVAAPLAVNVTALPKQMVEVDGAMFKVGLPFTTNAIVVVPVQPPAFVPVSV